ncbi:hypothetical protein MB46_06795 [Arthrobacter alpinus]|uniref:YegP family protein n=1 Tax=Arthrobacter alpinus TaxID=656366 RepID=UPI0005C8E82D|nr:hypothetical protein [Arthrobacter alpinus]ALV45251.1 hypothetical protein MB46_06795 [Arthrobacter alpinus]
MAAQFEIILYADERYRFRLACAEGRTLLLSGPYETKRETLMAVHAAREDAAMAHIKVLTNNTDQTRGLGPVAPSLPVRAGHLGEEFCNPARDHPAGEPFQP